jgi:RHS repeat-associated protein
MSRFMGIFDADAVSLSPRRERCRSQRRSLVLIGVALCCVLAKSARAQDYLEASGSPTFSAPEPVELGFTDSANGNLHIEVPFGSYPQRGSKQPLTVKEVYDSTGVWTVFCGSASCQWSPLYGTGTEFRFITSAAGSTVTGFYCGQLDMNLCGYIFTSPIGTQRYFYFTSSSCPVPNVHAADSSGYMVVPCGPNVYAPDGTLVYEQGSGIAAEDSNGNYVSPTVDTLGRQIPVPTTACNSIPNETCYDLPNSQGGTSTSRYTVTTATIPVQTNFGESGVSEYTGTIQVVQNILLPDNTSYTFTYDCYQSGNAACGSPSGQSGYFGLLSGMTLPTGGTIKYGYTTFKDSYSNMSRWLTSRLSDLGTWSYTPDVISTCSSSQVGCQQSVTVDEPSGASRVYTFTLNNGAWPVSIKSYQGTNLLSTVANTYDFSNACLYSGCYGAAYIRLLTAQTTVSVPSGSITKQSQYTYDSPQTGNITAVKEWGYYSGTSPSFPSVPDRATYTQYLTTGTNDIDRPVSVTACNNSGSDSACPGGGTRVTQTLYAYDQYSSSLCPAGGLESITGVSNHDDTDFGKNYTTRGNPTSIQRWVAGTTYLTTQLCYDTTGQVTAQVDPASNITGYSYADAFFNDTGANPPQAYAPTNPTNAYLTTVTWPKVGNTTMTSGYGYYYGSGNQALITDPNSTTTYHHYMDPFDRLTEKIYPIGWDLGTYPSETESDTYVAVGDTSPSTGCSSCVHSQVLYDILGRQTSQIVTNNPIGPVTVSTVYDNDGRVSEVSYPYTGTSAQYEGYSYDGLDRVVSNTHPDGEYTQTFYGTLVNEVGGGGGLGTQQGSTTTYGYGYPVLAVDETGKQKQEWIDGFGRIIEVDEPVTVATPGTGSVTIWGSESCQVVCLDESGVSQTGNCQTWCNAGGISVMVNGFTESAYWSEYSTASTLATALANAFNSGSGSPVTAIASGSTVSLTATQTGSASNYSLSVSVTFVKTPYFSAPSFGATASGSALTGGSSAGSSLSTPVVTLYKYDAANDLTQVIQGGQTRTFGYDGLNRKTSENTPEAGSVAYSYASGSGLCSGDASNICSRTDARGVVSTYTYDALNRSTGVTYTIPQGKAAAMPNVCTTSSATSANACYYYDQGGAAAYALGRETEMVDPSGSETYTYNQMGWITKLQKVIGTTTYSTSYQYNAGGELTQITYPSGRTVQQNYNVIGQLCELAPPTGTTCGSSSTPYAEILITTGYDAAGHVLSLNYGNGVSGTLTYSGNRLQLSTLNYAQGSSTLYSLKYFYQLDSANCKNGSWANDGLINCITDSVDSGRTANYTYDALGRIIAAGTNGSTNYPQWGLSETYDRFGNRWTQAVTAGSAPGASLTFGSNGMNSSTTNQPNGYTYDASGNLTVEPLSPSNNYTYDGENRMVAFSGNNGTASYTYDGNGNRVQKSLSGGTSTISIFAGSAVIAEYDNGAAPTSPSREYIQSAATGQPQLLAMIAGGTTTTFYHNDHLSVRLTTDGTVGSPTYGQVLSQEGHFPFGESWYQSGPTNKWFFTSYDRDSESGLDYALARYYDSRTGTFCSADPLAGSPDDPQTWNRYPYGRNDPVDMVDPSGKGWLSWLIEGLAIGAAIALPELDPALFSFTGAGTATGAASTVPIQGMSYNITYLGASIDNWSTTAYGTIGTSGFLSAAAAGAAGAQGSKAKPKNNPCNNQAAVNFVKSHEGDAAAVAKTLNVPTENVLGLSARESAYGAGRFAQEGNAFFNLEKTVAVGQTPTLAPFSTGYLSALSAPQTFVFTYPSYLASAKSFAAVYGKAAQGIRDPQAFLSALKKAGFNSGKDFTDPSTINMTKARMGCP